MQSLIIKTGICLTLFQAILCFQTVNGQSPRDYFNITYENNFNDDQTGDYLLRDFYSDFRNGGGSRQSTLDILSESGSHNKFMRGYFPKGQSGPYTSGWSWYTPVSGTITELYFSYDIRFKPGFQWILGGKIPGLFGGTVNSGTYIKPTDGFSVRPMWLYGKLVFYVYHHDMKSIYGDTYTCENFSFVTGTWYNITMRVVLNSVGSNNGILEGFVNGKLVLQKHNFKFRTSSSITIDNLYMCSFYGGSGSEYNATRDEWIDTDNYIAYSYSSKAPNVPRGNSLSSPTAILLHPNFGNSGGSVAPPVTPPEAAPSTGAPTAPTTLINTVKTTSLITLQWIDRSSNETGFSIFRSGYPDKSFTEIGRVGANVNSYTISSLPSMTRYFYKVRAYNGSGASSFTSTIGVTTLTQRSLSTKSTQSNEANEENSPDNSQHLALEVFPNPITESATIRITPGNNPTNSDIIVRLVDLAGNEFLRESFDNSSGIITVSRDFSMYPKGAYLLQLISGKTIKTEKIILQ